MVSRRNITKGVLGVSLPILGIGIMQFGRPVPEVVLFDHRNGNPLMRVHNSGRGGAIRASVEYLNSQDDVIAEFEKVIHINSGQTKVIEIETKVPDTADSFQGKARANGLLG